MFDWAKAVRSWLTEGMIFWAILIWPHFAVLVLVPFHRFLEWPLRSHVHRKRMLRSDLAHRSCQGVHDLCSGRSDPEKVCVPWFRSSYFTIRFLGRILSLFGTSKPFQHQGIVFNVIVATVAIGINTYSYSEGPTNNQIPSCLMQRDIPLLRVLLVNFRESTVQKFMFPGTSSCSTSSWPSSAWFWMLPSSFRWKDPKRRASTSQSASQSKK